MKSVTSLPAKPSRITETDRRPGLEIKTILENGTIEWDKPSSGILSELDIKRLNEYWAKTKSCKGTQWFAHKAEAVKMRLNADSEITVIRCAEMLQAMKGMDKRTCKKYLAALRPFALRPRKRHSPARRKRKQ
jgi:hypothetical protein